MLKHHMSVYSTNKGRFVESWLQINAFGKCYCFSKQLRKI